MSVAKLQDITSQLKITPMGSEGAEEKNQWHWNTTHWRWCLQTKSPCNQVCFEEAYAMILFLSVSFKFVIIGFFIVGTFWEKQVVLITLKVQEIYCKLVRRHMIFFFSFMIQNGKTKDVFANEILNDITNILNCEEVQNACDEVGISMEVYQAFYQLLKDTILKKGIKKSIFLVSRKLRLAKQTCNDDVKRK